MCSTINSAGSPPPTRLPTLQPGIRIETKTETVITLRGELLDGKQCMKISSNCCGFVCTAVRCIPDRQHIFTTYFLSQSECNDVANLGCWTMIERFCPCTATSVLLNVSSSVFDLWHFFQPHQPPAQSTNPRLVLRLAAIRSLLINFY